MRKSNECTVRECLSLALRETQTVGVSSCDEQRECEVIPKIPSFRAATTTTVSGLDVGTERAVERNLVTEDSGCGQRGKTMQDVMTTKKDERRTINAARKATTIK